MQTQNDINGKRSSIHNCVNIRQGHTQTADVHIQLINKRTVIYGCQRLHRLVSSGGLSYLQS